LKRLGEVIRHERPDKWKKNNWFLHHDNAPARTSLVVRQFLDFQKYSDSPPTCSPDLAPCDVFLFPKKKLRLKGRHFDTTEEIHAETHLRTSRNAWNHGKHAGIAVYMPNGTTSKETVDTRSYGKKHLLMVKFPEFLGSPTYMCYIPIYYYICTYCFLFYRKTIKKSAQLFTDGYIITAQEVV
jgi:hypothetical protein